MTSVYSSKKEALKSTLILCGFDTQKSLDNILKNLPKPEIGYYRSLISILIEITEKNLPDSEKKYKSDYNSTETESYLVTAPNGDKMRIHLFPNCRGYMSSITNPETGLGYRT